MGDGASSTTVDRFHLEELGWSIMSAKPIIRGLRRFPADGIWVYVFLKYLRLRLISKHYKDITLLGTMKLTGSMRTSLTVLYARIISFS
jgi:hypothetical protein